MTNKTGIVKLSNYVSLLRSKLENVGSRKRISINTLKHVSGLTEKSIRMHISWENWGITKKGSLIFNRLPGAICMEYGL